MYHLSITAGDYMLQHSVCLCVNDLPADGYHFWPKYVGELLTYILTDRSVISWK